MPALVHVLPPQVVPPRRERRGHRRRHERRDVARKPRPVEAGDRPRLCKAREALLARHSRQRAEEARKRGFDARGVADLTLTAGFETYAERAPAGQTTFESPLVSYAYERGKGARDLFNW